MASADDMLHFHRRSSDECDPTPPPGMTEEQLDFFTAQTKRAVRKGVRSYRNGSLVGFAILMVGLVIAFSDNAHQSSQQRHALVESGRAVAVDGCNRDFADRVQFRELLEKLQRSAASSKTATPEQKAESKIFYDQTLKRFSPLDCRSAERLLTDDADAKIPVIPPYYPGAPYAPQDNGG